MVRRAPAAFVLTFERDRIKESRQYFDSMTFLKQIGAQPEYACRSEETEEGRRRPPPVSTR